MSLRDDFLEALRSVKRDFFRDYEPEVEQEEARQAAPLETEQGAPSQEAPAGAEALPREEARPPRTPLSDDEIGSLIQERSSILDNFQPELHMRVEPEEEKGRERAGREERDFQDRKEEPAAAEFDEVVEPPIFGQPPRDEYDSHGEEPPVQEGLTGRFPIEGFENGEGLGDERTIISKNTVVRGAIQTDDAVRLFGQILGDIDCRSNVLVAGKVRGNTSAANAYIINAQVDGNLLCDDVINVTDDAWILGNIRAQQAEIDGKIKGNIEIRHSISIGSNSSVIGNISTDELEIRRGAFVNGQIMMYSPSRDVIDRFEQFDQ